MSEDWIDYALLARQRRQARSLDATLKLAERLHKERMAAEPDSDPRKIMTWAIEEAAKRLKGDRNGSR